MKKLNLFIVRPSDNRRIIYKRFLKFLKQQGIKVVKKEKT